MLNWRVISFFIVPCSEGSTSTCQIHQHLAWLTVQRNQFPTCCRDKLGPWYPNTTDRMFIINKLFRFIHNRLKYAVCCNAHSCLRFHKSSVMHSLTSAPASTILPSDFTETTRQVLSSTTTIIRLLLRKYTPIECDLALGTFRDYSTWNYFLFV